jgi:hypothetical protein
VIVPDQRGAMKLCGSLGNLPGLGRALRHNGLPLAEFTQGVPSNNAPR